MQRFGFHELVADWFASRFDGPTEPQAAAWPAIADGRHTLVAAPTGSGKTLTAFLAQIDRLLKRGLAGDLRDELSVVYVSPLRALSNDMHRNLEEPLAEIAALAAARGVALPAIKVGLRTGDTSSSQRAALVRKPPHILVTTPESLYLLLTSDRGREALATTETLIVDEIHALVRDKRGSHLALSVERLEHLVHEHGDRTLQRIGLSATQKPIDVVAEFLVGPGSGSNSSLVDVRRSSTRHDEFVPDPFAVPSAKEGRSNGQRTLRSRTSFRTNRCLTRARTNRSQTPTIIDVGHARELDLAIEVPPSELGAICTYEQWDEIGARLVELINEHRSTLIFVNTRRLAERVTHQLTELLGEEAVGAHHGSLAADKRHDTERRLKQGDLKAVVATASLELGLDVGFIDLVIQIGSPRSIATFLQRIGRSGHSLGLVPKGRLFALTRDELVEAMSLIRAVRGGRLDAIRIPRGPLDVLAQQIVAEAAVRECGTDELFALFRRSYPYHDLERRDFDAVLEYLSEGIANHNGRSRRYLHHDQVNGRITARKGARIVALSNGGAIAEIASFRVVAQPEGIVVGTLDEDFATESSRGDVFLLGNTSWRFEGLRGNDVMVSDAHGAPPTIPFWRGEAPGRTMELSEEVSRLRTELESRITTGSGTNSSPLGDPLQPTCTDELVPDPFAASTAREEETADGQRGQAPIRPAASLGGTTPTVDESEPDPESIVAWLIAETSCNEFAATQIVDYAAAEVAAIGLLPTQDRVVFERFFDETGGMQLVVHAPFGGNVCRAWGYAMRKRFCRSFDFELQATADDDGFILSLGPQHSFPIESLFPMLTPENARGLLEQAVLTVPVFEVRWRWNLQRSLLVERMRNGKKVPPALQRFRADDLLTAVFPKLTGCQEEHTGDHEIPDHPLTNQTMHDALTETLDIDGLNDVLGRVQRGEIELVARDTREPSPFAYELLNANPYAFLDGGEAAERRTRAVSTRRSFDPEDVNDLTALDPAAIARVVEEAQPPVRNADELHDLLLTRIVLRRGTRDEGQGSSPEGAKAGSPGREPREGDDLVDRSPGGATGAPDTFLPPLRGSARSTAPTRGSRPGLPYVAPPGLNADRTGDLEPFFDQLANGRRAARFDVDEQSFWVAAERLPFARAAFGDVWTEPAIEVPAAIEGEVDSVESRVAIVRGYVETSGPVTAAAIAAEIGFTVSQVDAALEAIEGEGVVLRGRFTPGSGNNSSAVDDPFQPTCSDELVPDPFAASNTSEEQPGGQRGQAPIRRATSSVGEDPPRTNRSQTPVEWCHRRLLARIHRLTLRGLREQIEPVGIDVFQRFLFRHHGLVEETRRAGSNGVFEVVQMLEGLDVPAVCWERDLLPARVRGYEANWLDELCLTGEVGWARLFPPARNDDEGPRRANVTRVVPVSLFLREDAVWLRSGTSGTSANANAEVSRENLGESVGAVLERLETGGATFATDLASELGLLPYQLSDALGDLAARGLVTADGFAGLRQLTNTAATAKRSSRGRGGFRPRRVDTGIGRWTVSGGRGSGGLGSDQSPDIGHPTPNDQSLEAWAWLLLRRWGVVFRELLDREQGAPRWWRLLQFYRRAEARGEIRGGRFVGGVGGEQYALPHVVEELRRLRDESPGTAAKGTSSGEVEGETAIVLVAAADPLNLTGIVGPGERVPATASNRIAYADGRPVAAWQGGDARELEPGHLAKHPGLRTALEGRVSGNSPWRRANDFFDSERFPPKSRLDDAGCNGDNERSSPEEGVTGSPVPPRRSSASRTDAESNATDVTSN